MKKGKRKVVLRERRLPRDLPRFVFNKQWGRTIKPKFKRGIARDSPVFVFFCNEKEELGIGCSKVSVISTPASEVIFGTERCLVELNAQIG